MKAYAKFLFKRITQRKSNICLIIAVFVILCFVQIMNITMQDRLKEQIVSQMEINEKTIDEYNAKLSGEEEGSIEFLILKETIELNEMFLKNYTEMNQYYDNEDWQALYEIYENVLSEERAISENSRSDKKEDESYKVRSDSHDKKLAYIEYLDKNNLAYEDEGYAIFGLSFLASISRTILPILVLVCCIYIVAQLFTIDYKDTIDMSKLIPIGKKKKECTKLLMGIGISIAIFLFMSIAIFLFSLCTTLQTGFDYPLLIKDNTQTWTAINLMLVLKDWIFLGILFYISSCFFTYLVSSYVKEEVPLFLITICIILGLSYLPNISSILMPISQYMPTTYLYFVDIVNGSIANQQFNYNITVMSGIIILSITILLQYMLYWIKNRLK